MIIAWDNKADTASVTASDELATLPGSNVQTPHIVERWQTANADDPSAYLIFNTQGTAECSLLALLGVNLRPTADSWRLRASLTDPNVTSSLSYDSGTQAVVLNTDYDAIFFEFAAASGNYWRLDINRTTPVGVEANIQVGRVFLGPHWEPSVGHLFGWGPAVVDPSIIDESYGGQEWADERPQRRVLRFALDYMTEAEMFANAFAMARANGSVRDVLVIPDIDGDYVFQQSVYGRLVTGEPLFHRLPQIWQQKFTVTERL